MRAEAAVAIAVLVAVAAAASGHPAGTRAPGGPLAVGYASSASLRRAVDASGGTIVRTLGTLHVAQVRGSDARVLRRLPGIRFVQRVTPRATAGEPVAYAVGTPEWQFAATHSDGVPDAV